MEDRGLDGHGHIRREGDLRRVQPEFAALVDGLVQHGPARLGEGLQSLMLYGSIPRGRARPGVSDLDGQVLLHHEPTPQDHERVAQLARDLHTDHPEVTGVELLVHSTTAMVDPTERFDAGFHVRVLCTPLWGPDPGVLVHPHLPDLDLARHVQGDWRASLARLRRSAAAPAGASTAALCRSTGRRLARLALTWVLPRWRGWTSDPDTMLQVVPRFEPAWATPLAACVDLGWAGRDDPDLARGLLADFGEELTAHGTRLGA